LGIGDWGLGIGGFGLWGLGADQNNQKKTHTTTNKKNLIKI